FSLESDELMERAKAIRKKAAVTAEQAKESSARMLEAAERLEYQAKRGSEPGERFGIEAKLSQLKERLQDLRAKERQLREVNAPEQQLADVHAEISEIEQNLRAIHAKNADQAKHHEKAEVRQEFRQQAEKLEAASRRIHHIRVAAENLKQAEIHDMAHQLTETAESMEKDVQRAKQQLAKEMHHPNGQPGEHGQDVIQELRIENERLKQMIKELTRKIESR
ncbi:MAG: hypothetical protein WCH39_13380, partial [Schlesneria sp.]